MKPRIAIRCFGCLVLYEPVTGIFAGRVYWVYDWIKGICYKHDAETLAVLRSWKVSLDFSKGVISRINENL